MSDLCDVPHVLGVEDLEDDASVTCPRAPCYRIMPGVIPASVNKHTPLTRALAKQVVAETAILPLSWCSDHRHQYDSVSFHTVLSYPILRDTIRVKSQYAQPCHDMLCFVVTCRVVSCLVVSCRVVSSCLFSSHPTAYHLLPPYHTMPCHAMLPYQSNKQQQCRLIGSRRVLGVGQCGVHHMPATLYYTTLYYTILYYTTLHYTILYCYYIPPNPRGHNSPLFSPAALRMLFYTIVNYYINYRLMYTDILY